jgi:stage V sporulation protein R
VIDAALGIELNINPDLYTLGEEDDEDREELQQPERPPVQPGPFDDLIGKSRHRSLPEETTQKKRPSEPDRDLMLYIIRHSPKPLAKWEQDLLSVVRGQSLYYMPQRRTKIMNEGWATFWHMKIMDRLFQEGWLSQEEHGFYNLYNARVLAENPRSMNPYLVGVTLFRDIEERWNKGRFGREWEECQDPVAKQNWDLGLDAGRGKIFEVRRAYSDRFFIEQFLTKDLAEDLLLYLYRGQQKAGEVEYVIADRDWKRIKQRLVHHLSTFETPLIFVQDGDFRGRRELYLKHAYEETELDQEYREKTLEHIFYLWARPVHLETVVNDERVVFTYDGTRHHTSSSL